MIFRVENKKRKAVLALFSLFLTFYVFWKWQSRARNFDGLHFNVINNDANKISIIIVVDDINSTTTEYKISIPTVQCYAQANGYNLLIIDHKNKSSYPEKCSLKCEHCPSDMAWTAVVKFGRHCIVAEYLKANPNIEYVLALDADTGVVNPNHRIEDYIDPVFDLTFHERRYNYEIQAASYIAKNTEYARSFLYTWMNMIYEIPITIGNADNPALHQVLMEFHFSNITKYDCKGLWKFAGNHYDIREFVYCTRHYFGFNKPYCCNKRIRFYLANDFENPAWSRDGWLTKTKFSDNDFMFHDWKTGALFKKERSHWENPFSASAFPEPICTKQNLNSQWKYLRWFWTPQEELNEIMNVAQESWRQQREIWHISKT